MKFKNKESMKDDIETLGLVAISKLTSISYLCKTGLEANALIKLEATIKELECGLWSLIPLATSTEVETYNNQLEHVQKKFNKFIDSIKLMHLMDKE